MTLRYDRARGDWVSLDEWHSRREGLSVARGAFPCPQVMGDIAEYRSPLGTGLITSRSQRREDLARGNCREVDPSEWKPQKPIAPRRGWQRRQASLTQG